MKFFTPDYFDRFKCRAEDCPDSCCKAGWEIPIDSETFEFYRTAGIDVEVNTYLDQDCDRVFKLREDRSCSYFRPDGLCELYIATDGRLCEICAKYPRFFEEYDGFSEAGLSISCPTAAEMILSCESNPYTDLMRETHDGLLDFLVKARAKAMDMIFSEKSPDSAAEKLLGYGADLQELIDFDELEALDGLEFEPMDLPDERVIREAKRFILEETEILNERWKDALMRKSAAPSGTDKERRNYLMYLCNRYFLKAINTEDIYTQCVFIILLWQLAGGIGEEYFDAVRLISKEIGHNAENAERLRGSLED